MGGDQDRSDREVKGAIEAVDAMIDIVDGLEDYVVFSGEVEKHGTRYRLNLLWIHSFAALLMAPLLMYTGRNGLNGPSLVFLKSLPGSPTSVALILGAGGLTLGLGCVFRAKRTEIVGLIMLACFYLIYSVSLAVPAIQWALGGSAMKPPLYGSVVYAHLTIIMAVHVWGLIMKMRERREVERLQHRGEVE